MEAALAIFDLTLRAVLTAGTLYVWFRLWRLRRDTNDIARTLESEEDTLIHYRSAAATLRRFQEVNLLTIAMYFQAFSIMFLWVGFGLGTGAFDAVTTWISVTVAAGGVPLILTRNGVTWANEIEQMRRFRFRLLSILGLMYEEKLPPLMEEFGYSPDDVYTALLGLEKDGLAEQRHRGRYHRTEQGDGLLDVRRLIGQRE
jgi:hypothetical protein